MLKKIDLFGKHKSHRPTKSLLAFRIHAQDIETKPARRRNDSGSNRW
jgi:hypothetical protein